MRTLGIPSLCFIVVAATLAACAANDPNVSTETGAGMPGTDSGRVVRGIESCPMIDAPPYSNTSGVSSLSTAFNTTCVPCHGEQGRGQGTIPEIPGALSATDFKFIVRNGRRGMPKFDASVISDTDLDSDYAALNGEGASPVPWSSGRKSPGEWTKDDVDARIRDGLVAWRKPDSHGAACVNCHSPDAIELAIIGYPNADIARRSLLHLSPDDTSAIIDLVHAQRRRYGIAKTCDPMAWRPLQPGGTPVPGSGVAQELEYIKQLAALNLPVAQRVGSYDDAVKARDAWLAVKIRTIRSTITFSRWSEDRFHGAEHSSLNDWISSVPRAPKQGMESAWYGLHDAYLADPSEANLMAIVGAKETMTDPSPEILNSPSALIFEGKYEAVLLAQHIFRDELRGTKAYFDRDPQAFSHGPEDVMNGGYGNLPNPFWNTGYYGANGGGGVPDCNGNFGGEVPNCARLPNDALAELLPGQTINDAMGPFSHAWLMLGWTYDPGMMPSMGTNFNQFRGKYWELPNSSEAFFISHMRLLYQVLLGGKGMAVSVLDASPTVPPILDGFYLHQAHMPTDVPALDDQSPEAGELRAIFLPIVLNTYRMWGYLVLHEVETSMTVANKADLVTQLEAWKSLCDKYDDANDDLFTKTLDAVQAATEVQQ